VIRYIEKLDLGDPKRSRLKIRLGKRGPARSAMVGVGAEEVEVDRTYRAARWQRFWWQAALVAGVGLGLGFGF
jgi:hypothetical protein